jgi:hypothetical protein
MRSKPTIFDIESGEVFYPPGPYDGAGEETPWFMPDDAADQDEPDPLARLFAGGRRRERDLPFADPGAWARAEGLLPRALADAAAALARLAARLEYLGGAARVLPLELAELSWQSGARVGADLICLHLAGAGRATMEEDRARQLAGLSWAARRLDAGRFDARDLGSFLGEGEATRDLAEARADWAERLDAADHLHPLTRAAFAFALWQGMGLSSSTRVIEPAVMASLVAAEGQAKWITYAPLALGANRYLTAGGPPDDRLALWFQAAERGAKRALMELERAGTWASKARAATADLSGRGPAALIGLFETSPFVSTALAVKHGPNSRAATQANLNLFEARGLIREITGQGRFRLWRAVG